MRKERKTTIKVIENNKINTNRLSEFFARKYSEKLRKKHEMQNRKKKEHSKKCS